MKDSLKIKQNLFQVGVSALAANGWTIERIRGFGKSSVRRLSKGDTTFIASIRTSQNCRLGFHRRNAELGEMDQNGWATLGEVDQVVVVTFDDPDNPKAVRVYLFSQLETEDLRERFDRVYHARRDAKQPLSKTHLTWIALFGEPNPKVPTLAGDGPCENKTPIYQVSYADFIADFNPESQIPSSAEEPLSIAEAKRRLALSYDVDPANVKITIEF